MKSILLTLVLLATAGAHGADAKTESNKSAKRMPASESFMKEMNNDVASLLSTLHSSCPEKLAEAMVGANVVSEVFHGKQELSGQSRWVWQINTAQRYPAPSFQEVPVAALIIDWVSEKQTPGAPMAADRGTVWNQKCYIKKASAK